MPDPSSDPAGDLAALLARAAEGDQRAWSELVDAYARRVFALLHAKCGDPELAEELTQSTFVTVVDKIEGYTEQGRFESWLFRIAMNRLRDEMRRRKRHATPVESDALAGLVGAGPAPDPGPDPAELAGLEAAIASLPEADQQVIHLRHAAGLSFKQIADVLEQPLGTVLARQHRALKKVRAILEAAGEDDADAADPPATSGKSRRAAGDG